MVKLFLPRSVFSPQRQKHAMSTFEGSFEGTFEGTILHENVLHARYLTVYNRQVVFNAGEAQEKCFEYDVVGHPSSNFKFICVAPFHSPQYTNSGQPEFTIIREYSQGSNKECIVLPSGCYETGKHNCLEDVVRQELHEEAEIVGGTTVKLIPPEHLGFLETKWCRNRLHPFLNIDGIKSINTSEKDAEEFSQIAERVTLKEFKKLMNSGAMMTPSIITGQMAIDYLVAGGFVTSTYLAGES